MRNWNEIFRGKRVFVNAKLSRSPEIHYDVPITDADDLADPVVRGHWSVVDELSFGEQTPPRPSMEREDLR